MSRPKRGEIWLVDFNPARGSEQAGQRPAITISKDRLLKRLGEIDKQTTEALNQALKKSLALD